MKFGVLNGVIILFFLFSCCAKKESTASNSMCLYSIKIAENEIKKGNLYYNSSLIFNEKEEYYLFKKYRIISSNYLGYLDVDSCFYKIMDKKIRDKDIDYIKIKIELDNFFKNDFLSKTTLKEESLGLEKYHDGFYEPKCKYKKCKSYCKIKFPAKNYKEYQRFLLNEVLKIDSTFHSSSSYLEINNIGNVTNVQIIKKSSKKVDSLLKSELLKTRWNPTITTLRDTLKVRKYFGLGNSTE